MKGITSLKNHHGQEGEPVLREECQNVNVYEGRIKAVLVEIGLWLVPCCFRDFSTL